MLKKWVHSLLLISLPISGISKEKGERRSALTALYYSLDPLSILQNLAFYELYPDTKEGKLALDHAWQLLCGHDRPITSSPLILPKFDIQAIISLVTRQPSDPAVTLTEEQLQIMERISSRLHHKSLKGHAVWEEKELLALPSEEVDLARALLIYQFEKEENPKLHIRQYEASLDLMALQILVRLPENATPLEKIEQINRFIFQEMGFRFPPHSIYAKDIDLYTFLPSVLDSRLGVCLGVSILYLCLAQRLALPLEIVTPPGHIYLRYTEEGVETNIETTARGINLPSDLYLGVNTRSLETRNTKEVVGLAFINQASVSWSRQDYATTVDLYQRALPYLPHDPLLKMFLGMNYLFIGKKKEGKALLKEIEGITFEYAVSAETLPEDLLKGYAPVEGAQAIFLPVDENRSSILEKQASLQKIIKKYPKFRAGLLQLATTYLQLGRKSEALDILLKYHAIDPCNATVEYYLSILCYERLDYPESWKFYLQAEKLTQDRNHHPKALIPIRDSLRIVYPKPL